MGRRVLTAEERTAHWREEHVPSERVDVNGERGCLGCYVPTAWPCIFISFLEQEERVEKAEARIKELEVALVAVEYAEGRYEYAGQQCPECNQEKGYGHYDDCIVGNALKPLQEKS